MFLSALRSIKDDFSRSLFYWLTFVLTSMFIFLFFNICQVIIAENVVTIPKFKWEEDNERTTVEKTTKNKNLR